MRKYEEEHQAPENKFNIPKAGWFALVFLSAAFLVLGLLTSSIYYALPALLIILFVDRYGKDYILQDYNDMLEKRKIAMGMAEDLSDDERKNLMQALTQERLRLRREKRDRKKAEKLGISYDDYVQANTDHRIPRRMILTTMKSCQHWKLLQIMKRMKSVAGSAD